MPDDLFYPIGVVTCVIVFEAHSPHSDKKETFFGHFKNDGFIKRKHQGRIDQNNQWQEIKEKWLDAYKNHKNIAGLSATQKVTSSDEWCAEAYMETDYSTLTDDDFIKTIKNYVAFQFLSGAWQSIIEKPHYYKNISLNDREWRPFTYEDIFDIEKGFYNKKPDMREIGDIPFIGATEKNNGVTFLYPADVINETSRNGSKEEASNIDSKIYSKGCVTFSNGGSIGNVFYQNLDFTCAHHVNPIYIKNRIMTPFIGLFLSVLMGLDKYRYSAFGRECRLDRLPKSKIKLPIDPEGNPDWQFMEYYIKALPYSSNLKEEKDPSVTDK